ncbi:unnamed protein product [Gadus morhua 'NCC']
MAFTLYSLIQAAILCVNAVAVLHEERFLSKIGWGVDQSVGGFGDEPGVKVQVMTLIRSVRTVMRVPLIAVNSVCIVLLLLFGAIYLFYAHVYRSHKALKSTVVNYEDRLPGLGYLFARYLLKALLVTRGSIINKKQTDLSYTLINCRLENQLLRKFCAAAGYGWDYPDSEYRDVPLCFPEVLCLRLLLMVLTSSHFALNPAGLVRVRQTLRTLQPIDELTKGRFTLHARVLEYRTVRSGAEVDVFMSATSRCGQLVWESTLTLLSREKFYKTLQSLPTDHKKDLPDVALLKRVAMRVPWSTGLCFAWSFSDYSPSPLLSLPARLLGCRDRSSPSLWMLSVCLAEMEKHRGVDAIRPPINLTVQFLEPLLVPGQSKQVSTSVVLSRLFRSPVWRFTMETHRPTASSALPSPGSGDGLMKYPQNTLLACSLIALITRRPLTPCWPPMLSTEVLEGPKTLLSFPDDIRGAVECLDGEDTTLPTSPKHAPDDQCTDLLVSDDQMISVLIF